MQKEKTHKVIPTEGHVSSKLQKRENRDGYLFILPWILGFLLFTFIPIIQSISYSFTEYSILEEPIWVGLKNYSDLFADPLFYKSLGNTFYYVILSVPSSILIGLTVALLLSIDIKGIAIYRTLYYLPSIVPVVASSILWAWMFNPNFGILTIFVELFGIQSPNWLSDPGFAKNSLIIMSLWGAGGGMIVYLAGIKNVPRIYHEAAMIDGANVWQRFRKITLPLLSPTLFFQLIMGMIGSFQVFTQAFIMTAGGPNDSTLFYVMYLYNNAFGFWKMGYASALAWILFIIIMVFTAINFIVSKYWVQYDQG